MYLRVVGRIGEGLVSTAGPGGDRIEKVSDGVVNRGKGGGGKP